MSVAADLPDWMPDSQAMLATELGITTQIAALIASGSATGTPGGVPLLNLFGPLASFSNQSIPGNSHTLFGLGGYNQPYLEGYIQIANLAAANTHSVPVCVQLKWQTLGGFDVDIDQFWCFSGQQGNPVYYAFHGPNKAAICTMNVINADPVAGNSITVSINSFISSRVLGTFQVYPLNLLSSPFSQFGPALYCTDQPALASCDPSEGIVAAVSQSVNTGVTQNFLLPLMNGEAHLQGSTSSATNDMQAFISPASDAVGSIAGQIINVKSDATGEIAPVLFKLPPVQCTLSIKNNNAAAKTLNCYVGVQRP